MERLEWAREFFKGDKFATEAAEIRIEEAEGDYARCSMRILPKHLNAANTVMGGALFTLADFTFAVAANKPDEMVFSLCSDISFLSQAKGDTVFAAAKCVKNGKSACFYTVEITDSEDNLVANVTVTGHKIQKK